MYCRLQCYPAPRLISYKIPGIRVLWGFGVTLFEVSTLAAQGPDLVHYGFKFKPTNRCNLLRRTETWSLISIP